MIHFHLANRVARRAANRSRNARVSFPGVKLAACALTTFGASFGPPLFGLAPAQAAPRVAPAARAARTLSFRVSARFDARQAGSSMGQPQQTLDARVWASNSRVRLETRLSDQPVVLLYSAPYIYKLLPANKAGVRYNASRKSASPSLAGEFDLQKFLSNPALIRSTLLKQGARRGAATSLNGTLVDLYTASNFMGQGQNVKVWLRRKDALPLRLEARSNSLMSVLSWRDYKINAPLPASLFTRPANYKIRDSQSRPRLF